MIKLKRCQTRQGHLQLMYPRPMDHLKAPRISSGGNNRKTQKRKRRRRTCNHLLSSKGQPLPPPQRLPKGMAHPSQHPLKPQAVLLISDCASSKSWRKKQRRKKTCKTTWPANKALLRVEHGLRHICRCAPCVPASAKPTRETSASESGFKFVLV